jgi:hypothetical protein
VKTKPPILKRGLLNYDFLETLPADERSWASKIMGQILAHEEREARREAKANEPSFGFGLTATAPAKPKRTKKKRARPTVESAVQAELARRKKREGNREGFFPVSKSKLVDSLTRYEKLKRAIEDACDAWKHESKSAKKNSIAKRKPR